eukprot:7584-Heterococcus_DN1.PRE.2
MRQLAQTPEAVPFSAATEYGRVDTQTWDADKMWGCVCDSNNWSAGLASGQYQQREAVHHSLCTASLCSVSRGVSSSYNLALRLAVAVTALYVAAATAVQTAEAVYSLTSISSAAAAATVLQRKLTIEQQV